MKFKNYTAQVGSILKDAESKRAKIIAEAEGAQQPDKYIAKNLEKVVNDTRQRLEENSSNRRRTILEQIGSAREALNNLGKWHSGTGSDKQYYLMLASNITNAKSVEDGIKIYERIVADMPGKDRDKYRKIVDFQLKELVNQHNPEYMPIAEMAIDSVRSPEEKEVIREMNISNELWNENKIIENLITEQLQNLKMSENLIDFDWSQIADEIYESCRSKVDGKPSESELQKEINELVENNPYLESDHAVEDANQAAEEQ